MSSFDKLQYQGSTKSVTVEIPMNNKNLNIFDDKPDFETNFTKQLFSKENFVQNLSVTTDTSICIDCKGAKLACGKLRCPILMKFETFKSLSNDINKKDIFGSSPPTVFIGRMNYPNVLIGPMVPPEIGNTSIYDVTEDWFGLSMKKIIGFRLNLIRGKFQVNVNKLNENNRLLDLTREIGLAKTSVESEANFKKPPLQRLQLDNSIQPMGPSASLTNLTLGSSKTDHSIEKASIDTDLRASEAIINLRKKGLNQTDITRAFSLGLFGLEKTRKLVPSRWSITAVDSTLGLFYWKNIVHNQFINQIRVYESTYLANRFIILMLPEVWGYELMEAWFPNSAWNPGQKIGMVNDFEGLTGRKTYARIGGCYYTARNMVGEYLHNERRQARVVILRETYPGQDVPVGVWLVREMVRKALEFPYLNFDSLDDAFDHIETRLLIKRSHWISNSGVLSHEGNTKQKSLLSFI